MLTIFCGNLLHDVDLQIAFGWQFPQSRIHLRQVLLLDLINSHAREPLYAGRKCFVRRCTGSISLPPLNGSYFLKFRPLENLRTCHYAERAGIFSRCLNRQSLQESLGAPARKQDFKKNAQLHTQSGIRIGGGEKPGI